MPRVLIVDDDSRYLELLTFALESGRFEVKSTTDPQAIPALAVETDPDVIVSDVTMPGMDGFELARLLHQDSRTRDIPLIFLTARGQGVDKCEGQSVGAMEYLTKPFSPDDLIQSIRRVLSGSKVGGERS